MEGLGPFACSLACSLARLAHLLALHCTPQLSADRSLTQEKVIKWLRNESVVCIPFPPIVHLAKDISRPKEEIRARSAAENAENGAGMKQGAPY